MRELKLFIVIAAMVIFVACSKPTENTAITASANANKASANANVTQANAANTNAPTSNANGATNSNSGAGTVAMNGTELYAKHCTECHRANGTGGKVTIDGKEIEPDDLTTAKMAAKPDAKFVEYIADGFPEDGMPPFKDKMKPEEIKEVIKYLRSNILKAGK